MGDPRRLRVLDGAIARRLPPHHGIPDEWGTAVNVQQMVFGNQGRRRAPASRSRATRSPAHPSRAATSSSTPRARTWCPGTDAARPVRARRLDARRACVAPRHPAHARAPLQDMQDTEFTVEDGRPLHAADPHREAPAQAAVRFAVDAVDEGLLTRARRSPRSTRARSDALLHPTFDPAAVRRGRPRRRRFAGRGQGRHRLHRPRAPSPPAEEGRDVILVRPFTEADDVAGFHAAKGILTSEGGKASHAALVARGMGRPAVTGAALDIDLHAGEVPSATAASCARGICIAIDGTAPATSRSTTSRSSSPRSTSASTACCAGATSCVAGRARQRRHAGRRAPRRASFGAEGIGLCRTEHMFMAADRQPKMQRMILADDDAGRRAALDELLPLQQRTSRASSRRWPASR